MRLPIRFKEGDVVTLLKSYNILSSGGIQFEKGHLFYIENIIYEPARNSLTDDIFIKLVLGTCLAHKPIYFTMAIETAQRILRPAAAGKILYGNE